MKRSVSRAAELEFRSLMAAIRLKEARNRLRSERKSLDALYRQAMANGVGELFAATHERLSPMFQQAGEASGTLAFYAGSRSVEVLRVAPGVGIPNRAGLPLQADVPELCAAVNALKSSFVDAAGLLEVLPPSQEKHDLRIYRGFFSSIEDVDRLVDLFTRARDAAISALEDATIYQEDAPWWST